MSSRDRHDPLEKKGRQSPTPLEALEEVGDFHFGSDGFSTALEYYESALEDLERRPPMDDCGAARLHRKIADCHRAKGVIDAADAHLARAREFLRGHEYELEYGIFLGRRADVRSCQGKHETALGDAQVALDILKATAAHREYAFALTVAAICHGRLGHTAEFEELNQDALATYRRIEDSEGLADVYNNLGLAYKNACQWDKAIRSLTQAKEIGEKLGLTRRLARTLGNLGIVYTKTRDYHEAMSHLRRARKLVLALGDHASLISILNSLGRVLTLMQRYAPAQKCLLEARVLAEKHHLPRSVALADEFLGDSMRAQGRTDEARQSYESALKKARQFAPQGDVVGEVLRRIADLEECTGLRSQALATARRALKVCTGCGETHEIGFIHRTMGHAHLGMGKVQEAISSLSASIMAFERTRNPFEAAWSRTELARLHLQLDGRDSQLRALREAEAAAEAFRSLEEDRGYCFAGVLSARAHHALANFDDGLLILYDVERLCEENPEFELLAEVRALRSEFERALVSGSIVSGHLLFNELYALAHAGSGLEAPLGEVLASLCDKTKSSSALLVLWAPGQPAPVLQGARGFDAAEASRLAMLLASDVRPRVLSHLDAELAVEFPRFAERKSSLLQQPLDFEGRKIGFLVLERDHAAGRLPYTQDEIDFVATWTNLATVLLYEGMRAELQAPPPAAGRADLDPIMDRILTQDPALIEVLALSQKVARSKCTVLLSGETGTGKGLLAHVIHELSDRHGKKFIALNCAALPEPLLESELFGHVRGAFTGADADKMGLFESASGGTVFLDEVGKTSLFMQGKLLQFLDSSEVRPVGSNIFRKVDVRVICASKNNLRDLVAQGVLLEDLYYRLNDFPLAIPPLRDRPGDIPILAEHYLARFASEMRKPIAGFSRQTLQVLQAYAWPGNVRELEKCVKRAVILADEHEPIAVRHLADELRALASCTQEVVESVPVQGLTLRQHVSHIEAKVIRETLRRASGNKSEAARLLGISYPSLLQKIKLYGADDRPAR